MERIGIQFMVLAACGIAYVGAFGILKLLGNLL